MINFVQIAIKFQSLRSLLRILGDSRMAEKKIARTFL